MSEIPVEDRSRGAEVVWQELAGKGIVVHAPKGSLAARRGHDELHGAEGALVALERLLEPPEDQLGPAIQIYLTDPVAAPAPSGQDGELDRRPGGSVGKGGIVRVVDPEVPAQQIVWPLTQFVLGHWFGANAAAVPLFVNGIAGIVAARSGAGPDSAKADDLVRAQLAGDGGGMPPSIFPRLEPAKPGALDGAPDPEAISFVNYLLKSFGPAAFGQFLAGYDPERRDEAAVAAFQQPLGVLEAGWLNKIMQAGLGKTAVRDFVRFLAPLFRPYLWRMGEVLVYMVFGLGANLALPLATRRLIDHDIARGDKHEFVVIVLALLGIYLADVAIGMRRDYANNWIYYQVLTKLQANMFAHLQRLPHTFYTEARVGDVMIRLSTDLAIIQQAMAQVGVVGAFMALSVLTAAGALLYLDLLLGALVLVVVPLFAVAYTMLAARTQQASYARQEEVGAVAAAAQENLTAQAVVKAFGLEQRSVTSYHARLMALFRASMRVVLVGSAFEASIVMATRLADLVVIGIGGYLALTGHTTVGTLIAFIALLPSLFTPITSLGTVLQGLQMAGGSMARVNELLDAPVTIDDKPDAVELPPLGREIRLEHVSFSYDPQHPVLLDLDLTIPAGSNVAVVGPSGSGKSTIVNLLMRFWDPSEGRVLLDGHDLRDVALASLRGQIGLVFQDTFVFDTTVKENIAIGRLGASDAEIEAAAKAARLDTWIESLPAGYDTLLGERGSRMSGGQRQRLAIARALLRDPRVLILDEATSALDSQTEAGILDTLAEVAKGRTTISITHRLSLAATADHIVVLDQGRLVEQGVHAELLKAGGLYQRLYEEQTSHVIEDGGRRPGIRLDRLQAIPLLSHLKPDALAAVADQLVLQRYGPDEVIVRQRDPGDAFFLITRGQVDVLVEDEHGQRRVNTLNEGDFFGEMSLLTDEPRVATVKTTMPTDVYSLARQDLRELIEREPKVRDAVQETVAERRRALELAVSATEV